MEKEQGMKRKSLLMNVLVVTIVFWAFGLLGVQTSMAVEEHHQPGATEKAQASTEPPGSGKMLGSASGSGPGMMGMVGRGPGQGGGQGMTGGMDRGMMHIMMSHMMGGTGGMGRMMGAGEDGMPDPLGGKGGMGRMARVLDDLELTSDQWRQVRELARERSMRMVDLWAQRAKLQIEMAGMRADQEVDAGRIKSQFVKIAEIRADEFVAGLEYLRSVREVLTAEQRDKLAALGF